MLSHKKIVLILVSILVIFCSIGVINQNPKVTSLYGDQQITSIRMVTGKELIINCSMPRISNEVPYLSVKEKNMTQEYATFLGKTLFNLEAPAKKNDHFNAYRIRQGDYDLMFTINGGVDYYVQNIPNPKTLPSQEEAQVLATNFMNDLKQYNIFPNNPHINIAFYKVISGCESGTPSGISVQYWSVLFNLSYGNIKIAEPKILIGENGKIVGVEGTWREIEETGSIAILSPIKAIENIQYYNGRYLYHINRIVVQQVTLEYFDDEPIHHSQTCYKPIYVLTSVITMDNNETVYMNLRVPATEEPL